MEEEREDAFESTTTRPSRCGTNTKVLVSPLASDNAVVVVNGVGEIVVASVVDDEMVEDKESPDTVLHRSAEVIEDVC